MPGAGLLLLMTGRPRVGLGLYTSTALPCLLMAAVSRQACGHRGTREEALGPSLVVSWNGHCRSPPCLPSRPCFRKQPFPVKPAVAVTWDFSQRRNRHLFPLWALAPHLPRATRGC